MLLKNERAEAQRRLPSRQVFLMAATFCLAFMASRVEAQQRTYDFRLVADGAVLAREGPKTSTPCVVRVPSWIPSSERPAPDARYYLYYGTHHGDYIRMKWAPSIEGPWTEYHLGGRFNGKSRRGVFDIAADPSRESYGHLTSPDVHLDHEKRQFVMFYHGKNQPSTVTAGGIKVPQVHHNFVSTSSNGLNFHDPLTAGGQPGHGPRTVTIEDVTRDIWIGPAYQRAFQVRGNWYSLSKRAILALPRDPAQPFAHNPANPFGQAWKVDRTPDPLWHDDASTVQDKYFSPAASFLASREFAEHPHNPHPGVRILSKKERINHVSCSLLSDAQLEVFFYVRQDPDDRYNALYRLVYDIRDPDFEKWTLVRNDAGQVIFEVALSPEEVMDAVQALKPGADPILYADPISLGDSSIFVDDDGRKYLFFSYVSKRFQGAEGEGQIAAVELIPRQ